MLSQGTPLLRLQQKTTRKLSRQQLLALAPRTPRQVEVRYLTLARTYTARIEAAVRELVLPLAQARDAARTDAADEFDDVFARVNERIRQLNLAPALTNIGREIVRHADKEIGRTLGIDLRGQDRLLDGEVQRFVRQNVQLIRSVSTEQLERMRAIVDRHHAGQTNQGSLRDELMDTFVMSRARANLIARDQVLKANADVTAFRQQSVGVTEYIWVTANDERVRGNPDGKWPDGGDHWSLDGRTFRWDEPPVVDPKSGRRAHPGKDYQCRCIAVPVVDRLLGR